MKHARPSWDQTWLYVARDVAARSLCVRDQVGAVIVDAHNRIVDSGYNGPPAGFSHHGQTCDRWCERAKAPFTWQPSTPHTPVVEFTIGEDGRLQDELGVIIDDPYVFFTSRGYVKVGNLSPCYDDCPALHAEANAIAVSDRTRREGGTIYVTSHVCWNCAKLIANSGLASVALPSKLTLTADQVGHRNPERSYEFLEKCGVTVYSV